MGYHMRKYTAIAANQGLMTVFIPVARSSLHTIGINTVVFECVAVCCCRRWISEHSTSKQRRPTLSERSIAFAGINDVIEHFNIEYASGLHNFSGNIDVIIRRTQIT